MQLSVRKEKIAFLSPLLSILFFHVASAQSFKIGTIDIFGARKTNPDTILAHLDFHVGDSIGVNNFKPDTAVAKLKQIPGVKYATVNPVCCDTANNLMLYIGIGENDSVLLKYRKSPNKDIRLPNEMITAYRACLDQMEPAIRSGQSGEDDSNGYSLMSYAPARREQEKFIGFATGKLSLLANVLKNSKYEEQRAAAAQIIAYSSHKMEITGYLLKAVDDPSEAVRNNATRALAILAGFATAHPQLKIVIPAGPFIKMVNSIVWTDRNKGAWVLMQLTQSRDPELLSQVRREAMLSIIEMARWKDRGHAYSCFAILGRIAGVDESELITKNYSKNWPAEVDAMVRESSQ